MTERRSRRAFLRVAGLSLPVALAGCLGGGEDEGYDAPKNTVLVGPEGEYLFAPAEITVSAGTTVTWDWKSLQHNVFVRSQPADAEWQGTGDQTKTYDPPHTYEFEFTVPGTYEYVCTPHENLGMTGTVVVKE
ncbi:plastocyanin/azurin family copper-binding protein [Haloarchaeobius sp. TZWWS8]|uniref:plastocyanin/azurin family copper-binding protein n=1 Tax=Haloarchaeobius sp. TZWWS8 TaxID=3446121 RepID=UPI003EBCBEC0